jgi:soluble epoxide hydrolase / lipid-phosphate phosphatase
MITSRLWSFYPDRLLAAAFLALQYVEPKPEMDVSKVNAATKASLGYELGGYWLFFSEPDAAELMERNVRTFSLFDSLRLSCF